MRLGVLIFFVAVCSCLGDISRQASQHTKAVGDEWVENAIDSITDVSKLDDRLSTHSFYAEVSPVDVLDIVLLVDPDVGSKHKEKLASEVSSLLSHVINSNWRIAVANLDTETLPSPSIAKYTKDGNAPHYEKMFSAAILGQEDEQESPVHLVGKPVVKAFIIVTEKDLDEAGLAGNKMFIKSSDHITRVYGILNSRKSEDDIDSFLNWKNADGKHVLTRYGSLHTDDYGQILGEISLDIAHTLRAIFLPPTGKGADKMEDIFRIKVYNDQIGIIESGFITAEHYLVENGRTFTKAKLPKGICVDVTYQQK